MTVFQLLFLAVLTTFYIAYLAKMMLLRQRGVKGNILGKGSKPKRVVAVERFIQTVTYTGAAVQYGSVLLPGLLGTPDRMVPLWAVGLAFAGVGVVFFVAAIWVMGENWRAGLGDGQNTALVTGGVYKISRNPAFMGFDMLYLGCWLAYPNALTTMWCMLALAGFHFQIKSEEHHLFAVFGDEYGRYANRVGRYLGRKKMSVK